MTTKKKTTDDIAAEVEKRHAALYPTGCPNLCDACVTRLALTDEQTAHWRRDAIARAFKHTPGGRPHRLPTAEEMAQYRRAKEAM